MEKQEIVMKLAIVLYSQDPEVVWNAFRLAVFSQNKSDTVKIFLLASGVEAPNLSSHKFNIAKLLNEFAKGGGEVLSCTTCIKSRNIEVNDVCPLATMEDLYEMIQSSDKIVTF
jgi:uncharacterized protein involved in oxidation of intracellular sulfur